MACWEPGATVVHQEVWFGELWAARPLRVVEDTPDRTLLWMPHGTVRRIPATPPARRDPTDRATRVTEMLARRDWVLAEHVWDVSTLCILEPERWHAVWVSWLPSGAHLGWYVNLQRPYRRTPIGFEATDLLLDVVAEPDLSWRWKDADELELLVARGVVDDVLAERIRAEGRAVASRIDRRSDPFDVDWPAWRPDPAWPTPVLPAGWDEVVRG